MKTELQLVLLKKYDDEGKMMEKGVLSKKKK